LSALPRLDRYGYYQCGSPGYTAPEVLSYIEGKKIYTNKCDVYSLGVTFFILFYGYNPFKSEDTSSTIVKNQEGYIDFPKNANVPP
jgi:serine/threonine protein kinase